MARKKQVVQASQPRDTAFHREWRDAEVRAARICLSQPFQLIGTDRITHGQVAEQLTMHGTRARFECITLLTLVHVDEQILLDLVNGVGPHGSDRLCALWWYSLRHFSLLSTREEATQWVAQLYRPIPELVADKILHYDAMELVGTEDIHRYERESARTELAKFQQHLLTLSRGENA